MIQTSERDGIVRLALDRPPVNALNLEFVEALQNKFEEVVKNDAQAIVIEGKEGLFSAGLDVPELLKASRNSVTVFWGHFFALMQALLESRVPVIAAITGHAPAGGAVLALHCDYRVATEGDFRIGLNEVQVGLPVPASILAVLRQVVGQRRAAVLAMTATMCTPEEALAIGLVDELAPPGEAPERACAFAERLLALPPVAMNTTRRLAGPAVSSRQMHDDVKTATDWWFSRETQGAMRALVASLGK